LNSHRWIRIKLTLFLSVYCFLVCVLNLKI
jgi:hypothetical protein